MDYVKNLPNFLIYFFTALELLIAFVAIYVRITPYREIALIREGNLSACLSLLGALLGFALPLASAISHSTSVIDMAVWGSVALVVQILVYQLLARMMPEVVQGIARDVTAHGLFVGGISLVVGVVNAACMTY
jgi:putative membrane protein